MADLFDNVAKDTKGGGKASAKQTTYTAQDIEVLEGLEPVRKRPGMYIGGTDEKAYHHLVAEVLDNSMDEAVAGHAKSISITLDEKGFITIADNGRGIPIDPHPKFKNKSALEVIMTMLHSGGKFNNKVYATSGGLHGVGISVVNALSDLVEIKVHRDGKTYSQTYSRGHATSKLKEEGATKERGTSVRFHPDPEIFGPHLHFRPATIYKMARSKAYLFPGVTIKWSCPKSLLDGDEETPADDTLHFPEGLLDYLKTVVEDRAQLTAKPFGGSVDNEDGTGKYDFAVAWTEDGEGYTRSYCNTIYTPLGGTHESALRSALLRGLKAYADLIGNKKAAQVTSDDLIDGATVVLSVFIPDPQFQGQTKDKLVSASATKLVEGTLKDRFEQWLGSDPGSANSLLDYVILKAEERLASRKQKEMGRKSATRRLRLPGKLADCTNSDPVGTEIFLVEGDSAGGSAKQARDRKTQAILALRGKILNVASATAEKLSNNQELNDLVQALGCGIGSQFKLDDLRYERVVIMTDADVDGAHISSLLMTFFFEQMRPLVRAGRLFLAMPPLYRLTQGNKSFYARDDAHREELIAKEFRDGSKVDISRFKGLGEMSPHQLKETTMHPNSRTMLQVNLAEAFEEDGHRASSLVKTLMGKNPELRFNYIQANASFVADLDV